MAGIHKVARIDRGCDRFSMESVYSSGYRPDPHDAVDVLAFVLCPLEVFAPTGDWTEIQAIAEMIGPAKEEAVRRWQDAYRALQRN